MSRVSQLRLWPRRILMALVRGYQLTLSVLIGRQCRFYPTCSHYSMTALERFGARRGLLLTLKRLVRCHPWNPGGVDEVPEVDLHGHPVTQAPSRADNHVQCAAAESRLPGSATTKPDPD